MAETRSSFPAKARVIDPKTGKIVAYEFVRDGEWFHYGIHCDDGLICTDRHGRPISFEGVCLDPGIREWFTGRVDSKGTAIYENDMVRYGETDDDVGRIWYDIEKTEWVICPDDALWDWPVVTVIGRHESEEEAE